MDLTVAQPVRPAPAVLVVQLRGSTSGTQAGLAARAVPGVEHVATDLGRHQLIVRYDPRATSAAAIRSTLRARTGTRDRDPWLALLPRLARALPLLAALAL